MKTNYKKIRVALAGNANVGKSIIFNYLTGLHQHIGNWPGKTVEKAVGSVYFKGFEIEIIDLPGIYSLSTYSIEEIISREFLLTEEPDIIINVVDGSILERNLLFTLQLMELELPMIMLINQIDIANEKGIRINFTKLESKLEIPVIPTIATRGIGFTKLLEKIVEIALKKDGVVHKKISYGQELEFQLERLQDAIKNSRILSSYPKRWVAFKILEEDELVLDLIQREKEKPSRKFNKDKENLNKETEIIPLSKSIIETLEEFHGHSCGELITSEKFGKINQICRDVQQIEAIQKISLRDLLDKVFLHPVLGYLLLIGIVLCLLYGVFFFGDLTSNYLLNCCENLRPDFNQIFGKGKLSEILWSSFEGFMGGITIALPYILPFYFILGVLEDSGYITRVAYLMDRFMHIIGLHGKAFIPCMLGIGCNVPGCLGCRIMERQRDRTLAIFVITLIPCTAQSIIIFALIGNYLGFHWVIILFVFILFLIMILGNLTSKILPGEPMGLIMEMVTLRKPNLKVVLLQTWFRLKEFLVIALPLIIVGSILLKILELTELLGILNKLLLPVTVGLLNLPEEIGTALIVGITRKELAVVLLGSLFGTSDLATVLNPIQMIVFALVTTFYFPCLATIAALKRELKWRKTLLILASELSLALVLGAIVSRILFVIW